MVIKRICKYNIPVYPKGLFHSSPKNSVDKAVKIGATSAAIIALLQGCEELPGSGTTGPPPVIPDMITEADARLVIEEIFSRNDIQFQQDKTIIFSRDNVDSARLNLDGYNDSLRIGYEYISEVDEDSYNDSLSYYDASIRTAIESAINDSGPYIKVTDAISEKNEEYLENLVQTFIDSLKANGVI
ncbi:hypothetical protein ACFLQJ_00105 [Calditrichota bacterium]